MVGHQGIMMSPQTYLSIRPQLDIRVGRHRTPLENRIIRMSEHHVMQAMWIKGRDCLGYGVF